MNSSVIDSLVCDCRGCEQHVTRPYRAEDVLALRTSFPQTYPAEMTARKLWRTLDHCRRTGGYSHTFGALDPVQVVHMAPHLTSIYVSGWQSSSTASTTYVQA
jgi:isocitrate lyase